MSKLGQVVQAVEDYEQFVVDQVLLARSNETFGSEILSRWK